MPSLLLHLSAIERLAQTPGSLPADFAQALEEDLPYARFGAVLPGLPQYGGFRGGAAALGWVTREATFARRFHEHAPVALGLKMGELVAAGALVGTEAGLALLAGYFTHVCLDRQLHPFTAALVARQKPPPSRALALHRRIEWTQTVRFLRAEPQGSPLGQPVLRERYQVAKSTGFPLKGMGGGIYELVRLASQETLSIAPTKAELDDWVRGLYLAGALLSTPLGRVRAQQEDEALELSGEEVVRQVDEALVQSREVLRHLQSYMARGTFTQRSRERFFESFPEGSTMRSG